MNLVPFREILVEALSPTKVFIHHMPETITIGVLLLHPLSGNKLTPELPGYKKGKLQAIVRSNDFESGYDLAKQVMDFFKGIKRYEQGSMFFHYVEPLNDPIAFPVSKGDLIEFSVNFETAYTET